MPFQKLDFVGDAYRSRSVNMNAQRTVNLYPEVDPSGANMLGLYNTPGTVREVTLAAAAVVRQALVYDGVLYMVCGNKFYSIDTNYSATEQGTLTTSTGYVSMCTNGLVILIVDGTDGYTYTIATDTFATIVDGDFPDNPTATDILNNTFIVIDGGTQTFYTSPDGTTWAALDFASAEYAPDNLVGLIVDHQEVIFGGEVTVEVWYIDGNGDFTRRTVIETGLAGVGAITKGDNSVFFLGNDKVVWRIDGYNPKRVSTHAIEFAIQQYSTVSDCLMWTQKVEGHVFVWCTFPTGNQTWVYDVAANMWHQRAWREPATGNLYRHRANCYAFFNNQHVVGDYEDGRVYTLNNDVYDDDGDELPSIRVCRHITDPTLKRVIHDALIIDMETGVGLQTGQGEEPQAMLKWSDDGGHTWSNELWRTMGRVGDYRARLQWNRLGQTRDRVYWVEVTDPVKRVFIDAVLRGRVGTS